MINRRSFLRTGALGAGAYALGPAFWGGAFANVPQVGPGPFGPLGPPDVNGIRLPAGFSSRLIAQGGVVVPGTAYTWHPASDGSATYPLDDGGFILVSNSELPGRTSGPGSGLGGASSLRFRADGTVADAYRILSGTEMNCSGGKTPWNTWLSCEEVEHGRVWECDPFGRKQAVVRPAMGVFSHEACAADPVGKRIYMTEDVSDGAFYRFTPDKWGDVSSGLLELAVVLSDSVVAWKRVPDPSASKLPCRKQVPGATRFRRGEGIAFHKGIVYVATSSDDTVRTYDTVTETMDIVYEAGKLKNPPAADADNILIGQSGDLFVCEDGGQLRIAIVTPEGQAAEFLQLDQNQHAASESTGPCFDPSGKRMYFSSQRFAGAGAIFEISGPFRTAEAAPRRRPALRVEAPTVAGLEAFLRNGLPVAVTAGETAGATVALKARIGRTKRRGLTTIARARIRLDGAGPTEFRLRAGPRSKKILRGHRSFNATLTVLATDSDGNRREVRRTVTLRSSRRR